MTSSPLSLLNFRVGVTTGRPEMGGAGMLGTVGEPRQLLLAPGLLGSRRGGTGRRRRATAAGAAGAGGARSAWCGRAIRPSARSVANDAPSVWT